MEKSPLHQQVDTLPALVRSLAPGPAARIATDLGKPVTGVFSPTQCRKIKRIIITGCGDSHHAALIAELAFEQLAGLPCEPLAALQFSRYAVPYISGDSLVLAISVSGQVSRTIEALDLARQAGVTTAAITGSRQTPLAQYADLVLESNVPPLPAELAGLIVPGTRSFVASLLTLFILAIHIGQQRNHLTKNSAIKLHLELSELADLMEQTIAICDPVADEAALAWESETNFVYCGSGPNYGTAAFSAAKLLEASGDTAIAQDMEEWAHLQYFARHTSTPTILISNAGRDEDRAMEIATAAKRIGRQVAIVAPESSHLATTSDKDFLFPLAGKPRECFSPLLASLPGVLFASYRAQRIKEQYFRNFSGGRSAVGGGGISRIRDSHRLNNLQSPHCLWD